MTAITHAVKAQLPALPPRVEVKPDLTAKLRIVNTLLTMRSAGRAEIMMIQTRPKPLVILYHTPALDRLDAERIAQGRDEGGRYEWREILVEDIPVRWRRPLGRY